MKKIALTATCLLAAPILFADSHQPPSYSKGVVVLQHVKSINPTLTDKECYQGYRQKFYFNNHFKEINLHGVTLSSPQQKAIDQVAGLTVYKAAYNEKEMKAGKKRWTAKLYWYGVTYKGSPYLYGAFSDGYCAGNFLGKMMK